MADPLIGRTFREHQVVARLGAGDLGALYRAQHKQLKTDRALRFVAIDAFAVPALAESFLADARTLAGIRHKNIARVFESGSLKDGSPYLFAELLDGETVRTRLKHVGRLPVREALKVFRDVAAGLAEMHQAGLVHRDISPDNVMLAREGGVDVAKIADFGIALPLDADGILAAAKREFHCKVCYVAPEQLGTLRPGERLDPRADVYALGLSLHEALTGSRVYRGTNAREVLEERMRRDPAPPSAAAPGHGIEAALDELVLALVARKREERLTDATEVMRALDGFLLGVRRPGPRGAPAPRPTDPAATTRPLSPAAEGELEPMAPVAWSASEPDAEMQPGVFETVPASKLPVAVSAPVFAATGAAPARSRMPLFLGIGVAIVSGLALAAYLLSAHALAGSPTRAQAAQARLAAVETEAIPASEAAAPASGSDTLDVTRLEAAIVGGDSARLWDWIRTFPQSAQRERAYLALLALDVPAADVCADVRAKSPALLAAGSRLAASCPRNR